jgi:hypothetical protein
MILQEKLWGLTNMGQLNSETKYIYERADGVVYAREFGAEPNTRKEIGWDYDPRTSDGRPLSHHITEDKMWGEIRRMAPTNPALQKALNRAIMIYRLSKDNPQ